VRNEGAIITTMVQTIQQPTAITTIRPMPTTILVFVSHSNTISRLHILRNIYNEGISIKEIYPNLGKHESVKHMLVQNWNTCVLRKIVGNNINRLLA